MMRPRFPLPGLPLLGLITLAGCVAPRLVPDAARPTRPATPVATVGSPAIATPTPASATAPATGWEDAPLSAGRWAYVPDGAGTSARFLAPDGAELASLRCEFASRRVALARGAGPAGAPLVVRTSHGDLAWSGAPRPATDPGLDWIAFSRGRFAIEGAGGAALVLPVWAEVARVVEDCRG